MLITIFSEYIGPEVWLVKIRYYEKVTKFEKKNLPVRFDVYKNSQNNQP